MKSNKTINLILAFAVLSLIFHTTCISEAEKATSTFPYWSDEFTPGSISSERWTYDTGAGGWGNNEKQNYTNTSTNSYITMEDGNSVLAIKAIFNGDSDVSTDYTTDGKYTSARIKTIDKFSFKYGKVEARIKLPNGKGMFPAFWMLGQNYSSVGWPKCGEIDIMEFRGGSSYNNESICNLFWDDGGTDTMGADTYTLSSGIFNDNFHIFTAIWNENEIKWYVDNTLFHTQSITASDMTEFHEEFFIIINMACGSTWAGYPDSSVTFPQYLYVDWVRVYK